MALGLDLNSQESPEWDPLGDLIRPGDHVLLKPNLLSQSRKGAPEEWQQVITHGSVVRAVADYVLIALNGRGSITIADGPQLDSDWGAIMRRSGLQTVCRFLTSRDGVPVSLLDLRDRRHECRGDVKFGEEPLPGDPLGAVKVDLGEESRFHELPGMGPFYGSDYDTEETNHHHSGGRHEYRIAATVAGADVIINIPKLKTHKKVGVTLSLKNIVGVNSGRNWLPHYSLGDPESGGDQYPIRSLNNLSERWGLRVMKAAARQYPWLAPFFRAVKAVARPVYGDSGQTVRSGNWHGNDTCWRMVHDINRVLLYYDKASFPAATPRRYLSVVDGIVAGSGNGPEDPDAVLAGLVVAGANPVAVDCACAKLMGFDPMRIPMLARAFDSAVLPLVDFPYDGIVLTSNVAGWSRRLVDVEPDSCLDFRPHFGWLGAMEDRPPSNKSRGRE